MKKIVSVFILFVSWMFSAQTFEIRYETFSNGKREANENPVIVWANAKESIILNQKIKEKKVGFPFEISQVIPYSEVMNSFAFLNADKVIAKADSASIGKQVFKLTEETKKILGYLCRKAEISINSNHIDVWYTNDLNIKGSPSSLGQNLGLVLEIERNKTYKTSAVSIKKIKSYPSLIPENYQKVDALTYKDELWNLSFTTIPVFKNETIRFSDESKSDAEIKRFANGTIILKKVKFPKITNANQVFAELKQKSNGDAYDRTGTVFYVSEDKKISFLDGLNNGVKTLPAYENGNGKIYQGVTATSDYNPAVELMRFFTSFGVGKFNTIQIKNKNWQNENRYRQDISEFWSELSGKEIWIGVFVGNYDKGGHTVDLEITVHPEGIDVFKNNKIIPLFNTLNIMEMAGQEYGTMFSDPKGLVMEFELKKDLKNVQLRYVSTGHGGWENGDEFVPKLNTILLDGAKIHSFTPWRNDCGSYRLYNPASGNFSNGLSSSDLSRSNWCPGTVTTPNYISLGDLKAGKHTVQITIPLGASEGNSFSSWNVSGVIIGNQ